MTLRLNRAEVMTGSVESRRGKALPALLSLWRFSAASVQLAPTHTHTHMCYTACTSVLLRRLEGYQCSCKAALTGRLISEALRYGVCSNLRRLSWCIHLFNGFIQHVCSTINRGRYHYQFCYLLLVIFYIFVLICTFLFSLSYLLYLVLLLLC